MIDWNKLEKIDSDLIDKIVVRVKNMKIFGIKENPDFFLNLTMDLAAAHIACPLNLEKLLKADNFNFLHDIEGIRRYIDRNTGKMKKCFLPRYLKQLKKSGL